VRRRTRKIEFRRAVAVARAIWTRPGVAALGISLAVAWVTTLATVASPAAAIELRDPAQVAREADAIIDRATVAPLVTDLQSWTNEILPWFAEERIVTRERAPTRVTYGDFSGKGANHVLGSTDCERAQVSINRRYVNSVSSMYRSLDLVWTLTHELAHVQQNSLCRSAPQADVETSAQLMAFEVDAALALNGNRWAGLALLRELRRAAVGMLQYDALRRLQGADERLQALCDEILHARGTRRSRAARTLLGRRSTGTAGQPLALRRPALPQARVRPHTRPDRNRARHPDHRSAAMGTHPRQRHTPNRRPRLVPRSRRTALPA
jgi:hypothetical protein